MDFLSLNLPAQADSRVWSPFQEAIFSAARETSQNLLIQAVAGSGKTTTLIKLMEFVDGPALFLAFNKAIAEDIKSKLSVGEARTLNSLGHGLWMRNAPGSRLEMRKLDKIIESVMPDADRRKFGYVVGRIISSAKASGVGIDEPVAPMHFSHFITNGEWDVDDADVSRIAEYACEVFRVSVDDMATFDFDDQIFGPVYHGWRVSRFGTVLVDEGQDLNRIQHLFVELLVTAGARLVVVGDRNQAIYAFRGALTDSLDLLKHQFNMLEFPLSISYRCARSIVAEAQEDVPHIQARDGAPAGEVLDQLTVWRSRYTDNDPEYWDPKDPQLFPDNMLIVCRNNAPLFAAIMRHVRARRPCRVLSNALEGLASFIRKFRTQDLRVLEQKLEAWLEKETLAAEAKGMTWKVAALADKAETVRTLCEGFAFTDEILNVIEQLSKGKVGPRFATIHKSKGLEEDHVYFLRPDLVPGWWIKDPEALQQERNLRYVARTRAKLTLTYGVRKQK